jgi:hypothetical protein
MKWTLLQTLALAVFGVLVLLIGCSEAVEEVTAPEVAQFTADEELEEEPAKDMGLEPVIFVGDGPPSLWLLNADGKPCRMSFAEWLESPAGQMFLGPKHCEDFGLGIDLGDDFPSWDPQPDTDGGGSAGGGGGGAD